MRISDWSSDVCSSDLVIMPVGSRSMYSAAVFAVTFSSKSPIFARMASRGIASESLNIIHPHYLYEMRCTGAIAAVIIFRRARHKTNQFGVRLISDVARSRESRSEEHTSEVQSLMRVPYAVFCLKKKN